MNEEDKKVWEAFAKTVTPIGHTRLSFMQKVRHFFLPSVSLSNRLDMHGLTVQQAYETFLDFLALHVNAGTRRIVVITGKGQKGQGLLKKEFPLWLEKKEIKDKISKVETPPEAKGGSGALILYLKRKKHVNNGH